MSRPNCGAHRRVASFRTGWKSGLMPVPSPFLLIAVLPKHDIQVLRLVVLTLAPPYGFVTPHGILSIYSDCLRCQQKCTLLAAFRYCGAQKIGVDSPKIGINLLFNVRTSIDDSSTNLFRCESRTITYVASHNLCSGSPRQSSEHQIFI